MKFVLRVLGRFVLAESGGSGMRSRTALEMLSAYRRALLIRSASRRSGYSMGMDESVSRGPTDKTSELLAELRDVLSDQEVKEFVTLLGELKDFDIFPCVLELLRALAHHIFAQDEYSP